MLYLDAANLRSYPGTGTVWTDLSGNGNDGTLVGGVGYNGSNGGSWEFEGTNDYVDCTRSFVSSVFNSAAGNNFTIRCLIRPSSIGTNQALVSQRHGDAMSLYLMDNGKITLEMDDTNNRVGTNTVLQNNTWYDISVVFVNNTASSFCQYYVNGNFERSETKWDGNGIDINNLLWIGWQSRTNYGINPTYFAGRIALVQIYNRALTAQEVQQNFNTLRGRFNI